MTFCLHEFSQNQEIQEKARRNIQEVLTRYDGKITYEALNEMTYLEQCINESLRKFPPAASLIRTVSKDYNVPDTKIVLPKGMATLISVYGIHHDPLIYEEPERFDPDRFKSENISQRHQMSFLPFGKSFFVDTSHFLRMRRDGRVLLPLKFILYLFNLFFKVKGQEFVSVNDSVILRQKLDL